MSSDSSELSNLGGNGKDILIAITARLSEIALANELSLPIDRPIKVQLCSLITQMHRKYKKRVVVIIDEYDAPVLDLIEQPNEQETIRSALSLFYGELKKLENELRLVYITGILKFSSFSLFRNLNNIKDHTFSPSTGTICGYTEDELRANFEPHLKRLAETMDNCTVDELVTILRTKYNGYVFGVNEGINEKLSPSVYNAFEINDILEFKRIPNVWLQSGHSQFLVKTIAKSRVTGQASGVVNIEVKKLQLMSTPSSIPYESLMFYAGYSTIKSYNHKTNMISLAPPNEVITKALIADIRRIFKDRLLHNEDLILAQNLVEAVFKGSKNQYEIQELMNNMITLFPHQVLKQPNEAAFNVMFTSFLRLGCREQYSFVGSEISTNRGDIEFVMKDEKTGTVCIFEMKYLKNTTVAREQIANQEFTRRYHGYKIIVIGINITGERTAEVNVEEIDFAAST